MAIKLTFSHSCKSFRKETYHCRTRCFSSNWCKICNELELPILSPITINDKIYLFTLSEECLFPYYIISYTSISMYIRLMVDTLLQPVFLQSTVLLPIFYNKLILILLIYLLEQAVVVHRNEKPFVRNNSNIMTF